MSQKVKGPRCTYENERVLHPITEPGAFTLGPSLHPKKSPAPVGFGKSQKIAENQSALSMWLRLTGFLRLIDSPHLY
jgi:hypothetical protein